MGSNNREGSILCGFCILKGEESLPTYKWERIGGEG